MWIVLSISVILLLFTIISFIFARKAGLMDEDKYMFAGVIGIVLTLFTSGIGMLAVGTSSIHDIELIEVECDVIKNERVVIVDDGEELWTLDSHIAYDNIDSNTTFYLEKELNHYYNEVRTNLRWVNDEDGEDDKGKLYKIHNKGEEKEGI
ncbi:MAG: hypothetical protein SLAVMIC_00692 [uncultured marine phage]|uniref:Uncharacterized protein n=1 Tax=uncultured marine phage TaxID=707152 RepID=A0A8D9CCM0_9VIRU|nr:MAG: hypothetical protein SLAVMIC_00692 [uncultured marine phage]